MTSAPSLRHWREFTIAWGECDPFGLVYYPHMLAWFNDTEHDLWRLLGMPVEGMIARDRTTFVMGEVAFRFTGPARVGERAVSLISLTEVGRSTMHWQVRAVLADSGAEIHHGRATRIYAHLATDGSLSSAAIPDSLRAVLTDAATQHVPPPPYAGHFAP